MRIERCTSLVVVILLGIVNAAPVAGQPMQRAHYDDMIRAIRLEQREGYDLTATTNSGRFLSNVMLHLVRWATQQAPDGPPLFIDPEEYFEAYLHVTGLTQPEVPNFMKVIKEFGLRTLIEYRTEHVIDSVLAGGFPRFALNVKTWWPDSLGLPSRYTYRDTLSKPNLQVINEQVTEYRLLDYGDMIVYDDVSGLRGRPTSGVLGLLFKIIGEGRVVEARLARTHTGLLLIHGRVEKGFLSKRMTVTIYPNGTSVKGLPQGRSDLRAIAERLRQPIEIKYKPFSL